MSILYAVTTFLSAFLLFQVQPLMGKLVLPWFGGTAAVWSACMLFFQGVLLLGYCYAHLGIRHLGVRRHAILHALLLLASLAALPLAADARWAPTPGSDPALGILVLMLASVGLPYFLLSATSPLLQAWLARSASGNVPYRLFALSNAGSLLGLLSYPLLLEPAFATTQVSRAWSVGYFLFAGSCTALALRQRDSGLLAARPAAARAGHTDRALWMALGGLPAMLLVAVTGHIAANIAPIPLLWVLPLALYLLTFILCFEGERWYRRRMTLPLLLLLIPAMVIFYGHPSLLPHHLAWPLLLYCAGLFVCCMACHGELARLKPAPAQLTSFYLAISAGGALGGLFVALLAPRLFDDEYELTIACIGILLVLPLAVWRDPARASFTLPRLEGWQKVSAVSLSLMGVLSLASAMLPEGEAFKARNFYGTVKVIDEMQGNDKVRLIAHGMTVHGLQFTSPDKARWPTSYFGPASGVGASIAALRAHTGRPLRVGVIGLGAGTIAAYCQRGDTFHFYEIDPLIASLARSRFTFLSDCPGKIDVVLGDARLSLANEAPQQFDVLVLDAFSGDAIPVHLLTREAFGLYLRHLQPGGLLAAHISNRYLDLSPVVQGAARQYRLPARFIDAPGDWSRGLRRSQWVVLGRGPALEAVGHGSVPLPAGRHTINWSDDYSSLLGILK